MNSRYQTDMQIEHAVAEFTDRYFWGKFKVPSTRVEDKQLQYAGVDVQLSSLNFDEKCKFRGCLNSVCQYPSFELQMTSRGGTRRDGWFFSALSTHYYAYLGLYTNTADESQITCENAISAVDMLWVKKSDVVDMVQDELPLSSLRQDADELVGSEFCMIGESKLRKRYPHGKFWLTYSCKLREQPVNLVTTRQTLEQLPHSKHFIITKEKISLA